MPTKGIFWRTASGYLLAAVFCLALILAIKKCNEYKHQPPEKIVTEKVDTTEKNFKVKEDSLNREVSAAKSKADSVNKKKDIVEGQLRTAKEQVLNLSQLYRDAKERKDTTQMLQTCDSLAEVNLILIGALQSYDEYTDTLTKIYNHEIDALEKKLVAKGQEYFELRKAYNEAVAINQNLLNKQDKEKRKRWNLSASFGGGFGNNLKRTPFVGITIGYTIKRF